ncbi:MAG: hypothetical protein ACXVLQ_18975 [Bacteriovorax sp.]
MNRDERLLELAKFVESQVKSRGGQMKDLSGNNLTAETLFQKAKETFESDRMKNFEKRCLEKIKKRQ